MKWASLILIALMVGCQGHQHRSRPAAGNDQTDFSSAEDAVARITPLLKANDWATLARFYDLAGTSWTQDDLASGRYFTRREPPPSSTPGIDWHYKHPFTPGFAFDHVESTADPSLTLVFVSRSFDAGGGMTQRVMQSFVLRRSGDRWKLVPDEVLAKLDNVPAASARAIQFRPSLADAFHALPAADVSNLVTLLKRLDDLKKQIAQSPPRQEISGPTGSSYDPSDEELLASEVGDRIEQIVLHTPPAVVERTLQQGGWTQLQVAYPRVELESSKVVGSGVIITAHPPVEKKFMLPKRDSGF